MKKKKEFTGKFECRDLVSGESVRITGMTFDFKGNLETVGISHKDARHEMRFQGEDLDIEIV